LIRNEGVEVELQMTDELQRFKPLPWENTDSTTFAHALQCSFRLLHLIVDCVKTLFNMIKLFCNVKAQFYIAFDIKPDLHKLIVEEQSYFCHCIV